MLILLCCTFGRKGTFMRLFPYWPFNFKWITLALYTVYCALHCYSITYIISISMGGCFDVCVCVCAYSFCLLLKTISISTRTSVWPMVKRSENLKFITNHLFVMCCVVSYSLSFSFVYGSNQIKSICTRALQNQYYTVNIRQMSHYSIPRFVC